MWGGTVAQATDGSRLAGILWGNKSRLFDKSQCACVWGGVERLEIYVHTLLFNARVFDLLDLVQQ